MEGKIDTRAIALSILTEVFEKEGFCNKVMEAILRRYPGLSKSDKGFISRLSLGTVERQLTLDYLISHFSKTPFNKIKPIIRNILRMTLYQILYMDVEDYAACDEAVRLVRKRNLAGLTGYVNAISRNVCRNRDHLFDELKDMNWRDRVSIEYSVPQFIISRWEPYYSHEDIEKAFSYFLSENRTSIRCNLSKMTSDELKEELLNAGVNVSEGECAPDCFKIDGYDTLLSIRPFAEGCCQVQDESSALVGLVADIKAGDIILDVCAAPGGKSIHAADRLLELEALKDVHGRVISCDISDRKLALIRENIIRCGFKNIDVRINDAEEENQELIELADVVIADIPCSGLGIIGKKPDIKYRVNSAKIEELTMLQKRILRTVARYVKPGGTLIFSTCTVSRKENEENVSYICRETGMTPVSLNDCLPEKLHSATTEAGFLQLLPGQFGSDGFFISKFRKNN